MDIRRLLISSCPRAPRQRALAGSGLGLAKTARFCTRKYILSPRRCSQAGPDGVKDTFGATSFSSSFGSRHPGTRPLSTFSPTSKLLSKLPAPVPAPVPTLKAGESMAVAPSIPTTARPDLIRPRSSSFRPAPLNRSRHYGSHKLQSKMMLRAREQAVMLNQVYSTPRHASEIATTLPKRPKGMARIGTEVGLAPEETFHHIPYFYPSKHRKRLNFVGIRHMLKHNRKLLQKELGILDRRRKQEILKEQLRSRNAKFSFLRPQVQQYRLSLAQLESALRRGQDQKAFGLARVLMAGKDSGARQPNGEIYQRLAKLDALQYEAWKSNSLVKGADGNFKYSLQRSPRKALTTSEYGMMLARCIELKDWGNGSSIAGILIKRYKSKDFRSTPEHAQPNSRILYLLTKICTECEGIETLPKLFRQMRSHGIQIPILVYESLISGLETKGSPGVALISRLLDSLESLGPKPTVMSYNIYLRAVCNHKSTNQALAVLDLIKERGYEFDVTTFKVMAYCSIERKELQEALNWMSKLQLAGFELNSNLYMPILRKCILFSLQNLPQLHEYRGKSSRIPKLYPKNAEWMYNALQVLQAVRAKNLVPTVTMHNIMIQGMLGQSNLEGALKVLNMMEYTYLMIPTQRTLSLFFEYFLARNDDEAAQALLRRMRGVDGSLAQPRFYHALYRNLLSQNKLDRAELIMHRMVDERRESPTEYEIVSLLWALRGQPKAIERVFGVLDRWHIRPIQRSVLELMRSRVESGQRRGRDEAWQMWVTLSQAVPILSLPAATVEIVSLACRRNFPEEDEAERLEYLEEQRKIEARVTASWNFDNRSSASREAREKNRENPTLTAWKETVKSRPPTSEMSHDQLLQEKALQDIRVIREHGSKSTTLSAARHLPFSHPTTTMDPQKKTEFISYEEQLENLIGFFGWVNREEIPVTIDGYNGYLTALSSHNRLDLIEKTVEYMMRLHSEVVSLDDAKPTLPTTTMTMTKTNPSTKNKSRTTTPLAQIRTTVASHLIPTVETLQIVNDAYRRQSRAKDGQRVLDLLLDRGGRDLVVTWHRTLAIETKEKYVPKGNEADRPRKEPSTTT